MRELFRFSAAGIGTNALVHLLAARREVPDKALSMVQ